jgi:hypothetical protein
MCLYGRSFAYSGRRDAELPYTIALAWAGAGRAIEG